MSYQEVYKQKLTTPDEVTCHAMLTKPLSVPGDFRP